MDIRDGLTGSVVEVCYTWRLRWNVHFFDSEAFRRWRLHLDQGQRSGNGEDKGEHRSGGFVIFTFIDSNDFMR